MNESQINMLIKSGNLRKRDVDLERIKSMLRSAETTVKVAEKIPLNEESATLVFREIYESIRQLGEAKWWLKGYEPFGIGSHSLALDILKNFDIRNKIKLNYLDRFKKIRHDANYRGMIVPVSQTKEILDFWNLCGKEIFEIIKKLIK